MPNGESEVLGAIGIPSGKVTGVVAALLPNRWVVRIETPSGELVSPLVYIQRTGMGDAGNVACTLDEAFQAGDITASVYSLQQEDGMNRMGAALSEKRFALENEVLVVIGSRFH